MRTSTARRLVWSAVLGHFGISLVHGAAHAAASVPMSAAANVFILLIIEAGPLVGLLLVKSNPAGGVWVIAGTMAGALGFGFVNHFVIAGADHVSHIIPSVRVLFAATAVLLALTEAGAIAAALIYRRALRAAGNSQVVAGR